MRRRAAQKWAVSFIHFKGLYFFTGNTLTHPLFLLFLLFWQRYAKINPCLNSINGDEEEEYARGGSAERDLLVREFPAVMRKVASELSG